MTKWASPLAQRRPGWFLSDGQARRQEPGRGREWKCPHTSQGANWWKTGSRAAILGLTMRTHRSIVTAALVVGCAALPGAQARRDFTAEDMLKVATVSVLDLSDDGRRVAVSVRRAHDNAEVDNRRYGDPTYLAPSRVTLQVIDTVTGAAQSPFSGLIELRQAAWSRDGKRLAILTAANGGPVTVHIWDAERKTLTEVPRKAPIAPGSALDWNADDSRLIVALRNPGRDKAAAVRFKALTDGPIIVQSSKDPFLDWDDLQRATRTRTIAALDPASGEATTIVPERKISSYRVTRDSRVITFMEDVTEKTDYDTIGGTMNALRAVDASGPSTPSTGSGRRIRAGGRADHRGGEGSQGRPAPLVGRWADVRVREEGEIFVQTVGEQEPRSLTPRPPVKAERCQDEAEKAEDAKNAPESFSAGAFSRDGAKLLITSKKGWYVVNVGDAAKTQVLTLDPEKEDKPRRSPRWDRPRRRVDLCHLFRARPVGTRRHAAADGPRRRTGGLGARAANQGHAALLRRPQSRDGSTFVFTCLTAIVRRIFTPPTRTSRNPHRLYDANPWMAGKAAAAVRARDLSRRRRQEALRRAAISGELPEGQKYPTVFELYETFFDNGFNTRATFLANMAMRSFILRWTGRRPAWARPG